MKLKLTKTDRTIGRFEKYLLKLLQEGVEVKKAVHLAYKKYPVMEIAQGEIEKLIYEAAELALGKPIQEELQFRLTQQPWANDGLVLSDRITKANVAVVASVVDILQHSLESSKTTYKVAKEIYEGYGKGGIIPVAEMANYIDDIVALAKEKKIFDKDFQKTIRKVKRQVDQLGSPALRASYKDILKAIQRGNEKALEKAVHVAAHEKTRYHAMRIARTETHRAYIEGQLLKDDSNVDVIAYKWRLSSRHPCFDICDVYANADLYGMGKGVFPVDKVPMLPAHPHCMCRLKRVIAGSIDNETPIMRVEEGGREYLDSLPPYKRQRILGKKGEQAYREGSSWTKHARGYTKKRLVSRLTLDKPNKIGYNISAESGALNDKNDPWLKRRDRHSSMYYQTIRNSDFDSIVSNICRHTRERKKSVEKVIRHVFFNKYHLADGYGTFSPSYEMAVSFQRLITGKGILPKDIVLLKHERLEYELMNRYGKSYSEAHALTNKKHNYEIL